MTEYSKKLIQISRDIVLELHYNPLLSKQPYLLKIFGYDNYSEHRLDQNDLLKLSETLADFLFDNPNTTGYDDNCTGLARLWHYRRNEALEQLEKYEGSDNHTG